MFPANNPEKREAKLLVWLLGIVIAGLAIAYSLNEPNPPVLAMWLAGAAALGVVSGFTTGASERSGTGADFFAFISAGIVVPVLGAVAAVLKQPQTTTETSEYTGTEVTSKVTEIVSAAPAIELHPLWVAGSFFVVFSLAAILGMSFGVRRRKDGSAIKPP